MRIVAFLVSLSALVELFVCIKALNANEPGVCVLKKQQCRNTKCKEIIRTYCCENWRFEIEEDRCKPICLQDCLNGTCTAPNTCSCNPGFKLSATDKFACVADCNPACVNAECAAPNVCKCFEGHKAVNETTCKPVCENCENGECFAPNICLCNAGYSMVNGKCTPICSKPCVNGYCAEPETCKCNSGYELDVNNKDTCNPICETKCKNALCTAPNTCSCKPGYTVTSDKNECVPNCQHCENGECVAPDVCKCHKGFILVAGNCFPTCSKPCMNGKCIAPDVCSCKTGYKLSTMDNFICEAVCNRSCVNSYCVSPNTCKCYGGYEESEDKFACTAKCESCINGVCNLPNVCECSAGFALKDGKCIPVCNEICVNSKCLSPNICSCDDGFHRNSTHPNICYKPCEGNCSRGSCNINGECICDQGLEFKNGTCQVMRPVECNTCNGNCTTNDICWCADGKPCFNPSDVETEEVSSNASMAGLEMTWLLGGAGIVLLFILTPFVIIKIWKKRQQYTMKSPEELNRFQSSVIYAKPNTLITRNLTEPPLPYIRNDCEESLKENDEDSDDEKNTTERHFDDAINMI